MQNKDKGDKLLRIECLLAQFGRGRGGIVSPAPENEVLFCRTGELGKKRWYIFGGLEGGFATPLIFFAGGYFGGWRKGGRGCSMAGRDIYPSL